MEKNDGGPPVPPHLIDAVKEIRSLRDWFAGLAMQAHVEVNIQGKQIGLDIVEQIARGSYHMADAMLKEREK